MLEEAIEEGEHEKEGDGTGTFQPFSDSDTTTLFQDLERELEKMVQKYHVPPTDLESLFQVKLYYFYVYMYQFLYLWKYVYSTLAKLFVEEKQSTINSPYTNSTHIHTCKC